MQLALAGLSLLERLQSSHECWKELEHRNGPKQGEKEPGGSRSKKKVATKKTEYGEDAVVGASSGH